MEKHNYRTFIRNWYRYERGPFGRRLVPNYGGRKTRVDSGLTYAQAQRACAAYNDSHKPGPLSRKMEFESY
jgi:hypothetical protein